MRDEGYSCKSVNRYPVAAVAFPLCGRRVKHFFNRKGRKVTHGNWAIQSMILCDTLRIFFAHFAWNHFLKPQGTPRYTRKLGNLIYDSLRSFADYSLHPLREPSFLNRKECKDISANRSIDIPLRPWHFPLCHRRVKHFFQPQGNS